MIDTCLTAIDRITRLFAGLGAACLALLFLLGLSEILARALFGASLEFALEVSGYLLALSFLLGGGQALQTGRHIRISLLSAALPPRAAATLDLAATLIGLASATLLAVALGRYALTSHVLDSRSYFPSATPLWIPQALLCLGAAVLALALLARFIRLLGGREVTS